MTTFKTHADRAISTMGCARHGLIQATEAQLRTAFGKPICIEDDDKFTRLWEIEFEGGIVAVIYDWDICGRPGTDTYPWHIGARGDRAVVLVHAAFRKAMGLSVAPNTLPRASMPRLPFFAEGV